MIILTEVISTIFETIYNLLSILFDSLINGLKFIGTMFMTIPNFLFSVFNDLPDFMKVGYTGLIGCLLLIALFKLISIIKGSG